MAKKKVKPAKARKATQPEPDSAKLLIAVERERQIESEGWSPEHDDKHPRGELERAAICYLQCARNPGFASLIVAGLGGWPWERLWFKPFDKRHGHFPGVDRKRCYVKAGALALAALDRGRRQHERDHGTNSLYDIERASQLYEVIAAELDRFIQGALA